MNILGISAFYHESACCLMQEGRLTAAAAEERFTRVKHDARLPVHAFRFCLEAGGLGLPDLDAVAYYERPAKKLARQLWAGPPEGDAELAWLDPRQPERMIRERLGYDGPLLFFDHHRSHAASAFFFSGFADAALLTFDGVGEWATTAYGRADGGTLDLFEEVHFPHSLGLLYATLTAYLGFRVNNGEYKVMGLAPYGTPRYVDQVRALVHNGPAGQYTLAMAYFDFVRGRGMFTPALCDLFGAPPRSPGGPLDAFHCDVARSLQQVVEEMMLGKVRYLAGRVDSENLCLAGGVALNAVAIGRIAREGPFARLFVPPAPGDAGGCLGAAALAHTQLTGLRPPTAPLPDAFLGPRYATEDVATWLAATGLPAHNFRNKEAGLLEAVVDRLVQGQVVGWFHGAMEFGPRALGARSLLANPMDPGVRDRLNRLVKQREGFRPFAPSVLAAHAGDHFYLDHAAPFMLETCRVTSPLALPAITHIDGSARPQTVDPARQPRFAALLEAFYRRTGCPLLLNTSFNVRGEPIVCTPADALGCLARAGFEALVLEDFLIERASLPAGWEALVEAPPLPARSPFARPRSALEENLYTFV